MSEVLPFEALLERAIQRARESVQSGGGPFGALVIDAGGEVVAEGGNRVVPWTDPTAHAEVVAIREACRRRGDPSLAGLTLVSSCEPCPMCLGAALWARLASVVYAADREDAKAAGFDDSAFYEEFALPPPGRRLPRRRVEIEGARVPFEDWRRFEDARPY